jgi:hypothetical protein
MNHEAMRVWYPPGHNANERASTAVGNGSWLDDITDTWPVLRENVLVAFFARTTVPPAPAEVHRHMLGASKLETPRTIA